MSNKKNLIILADGTTLWAGQPQKGSDDVDAWSYHFFGVYESLDDDNPIGMLGFYLTGTVASMWGSDDQGRLDKTLCDVMRLALPYVQLPINKDVIKDHTGSRFTTIGLYSYDQKPSFDAPNRKIVISGHTSPVKLCFFQTPCLFRFVAA